MTRKKYIELFFNYYYFPEKKMRLGISDESSVWLTIHVKCQVLFPPKNKKKIKVASTDVISVLRSKTSPEARFINFI